MIVSIFDTETTGLLYTGLMQDDKQPEIIEFMAVKVDLETGEKIQEWDFLVKPQREIPEEVVRITSIDDSMVKDADPFAMHVVDVREALENSEAVIAHNLSFDKEMIDLEMARCGMKLKWPRLICTVEQTMCLKGYRINLTDLHKELFNVPFQNAHRARSDVEALTRCVLELYKRDYI